MNKRRVKAVLFGLVVLLVLVQFVQPARTNPPSVDARALQAQVSVPQQVQSIFRRACYNCHSNQTVWPWYAHVAPVSWLVVDDVNSARRHFNFEEWDAQGTVGTAHMMCQDVREGDMPPLDYRIVHADGRLSLEEKTAICSWSDSVHAPVQASGNISQGR